MSSRRNISVTNDRVDMALKRAENMSKFIEKCILYYLDNTENEYATVEDLEELRGDLKILNRNYEQVKVILEEISKMLFK